MTGVMTESFGNVRIPTGIRTVRAFLRWADSAGLPEKLPVHYIRSEIWVDLSREELFSHNQIKAALGIALGGLIDAGGLGLYVPDGMRFVNRRAALVTEPDAMFISNKTIAAKRVTFTAGERGGATATQAVGTPDLVVEIVSPHTADKDTDWLMTAYHEAGIPEYWLIDARDESILRFDIYRRTTHGYTASRHAEGWVKSAVLKRSFRLMRTTGVHGLPVYRLDTRV